MPEQKPLTIHTNVRTVDLPPATPANFFHFAFSGGDVVMLVGFIDPNVTATALREGKTTIKVSPEISDRFYMTVQNFALLRRQVEAITSSFQTAGIDIAEIANALTSGK